jgi:hypothetical protein
MQTTRQLGARARHCPQQVWTTSGARRPTLLRVASQSDVCSTRTTPLCETVSVSKSRRTQARRRLQDVLLGTRGLCTAPQAAAAAGCMSVIVHASPTHSSEPIRRTSMADRPAVLFAATEALQCTHACRRRDPCSERPRRPPSAAPHSPATPPMRQHANPPRTPCCAPSSRRTRRHSQRRSSWWTNQVGARPAMLHAALAACGCRTP